MKSMICFNVNKKKLKNTKRKKFFLEETAEPPPHTHTHTYPHTFTPSFFFFVCFLVVFFYHYYCYYFSCVSHFFAGVLLREFL